MFWVHNSKTTRIRIPDAKSLRITLEIYIGTRFLRDITAQKIKFSVKDFFSKCDQIPKKLRIWSHLLKKSLMENFIFLFFYYCYFFCAVYAHASIFP